MKAITGNEWTNVVKKKKKKTAAHSSKQVQEEVKESDKLMIDYQVVIVIRNYT